MRHIIGGDNEKTNLDVVNRICEIHDEKVLDQTKKITHLKIQYIF